MKKLNGTPHVVLHCVKSVNFEDFSGPNANEHEPDKTSNSDTFYTVRDEWLNLWISSVNIMENAGFKFISANFLIT